MQLRAPAFTHLIPQLAAVEDALDGASAELHPQRLQFHDGQLLVNFHPPFPQELRVHSAHK